MRTWIDLAMGPLFAVTFLFMLIGLLRHLIQQLDTLFRRKAGRLRHMPWRKMARDSLGWVVPIRHLTSGNVLFSNSSFIFHIGAILVPLFYAGHIALWEKLFAVSLPALSATVADTLTIITILALLVLLASRLGNTKLRTINRSSDTAVLIVVLLPFLTGFFAAHPTMNPLPWQAMFLMHLLSAELLFVLVPLTKLSHIVLFFFDRISEMHWQLKPGAGDRVAETLFGKGAKI
ncbi:respiratory nitrate reductase subunit gamma [bacterium]|nr:respiratory nitrate reductase subunit gamma [bacterium]